jgi:DNA transformation protein and related proteins
MESCFLMTRKSSTLKPDSRKISQMRNLGPACERDLNLAGIFTAGELIDLGAEAAFFQMLAARARLGSAAKLCHAAYLYAIYAAIHDLDWREVPVHKKEDFKQLTAELRASGRYR